MSVDTETGLAESAPRFAARRQAPRPVHPVPEFAPRPSEGADESLSENWIAERRVGPQPRRDPMFNAIGYDRSEEQMAGDDDLGRTSNAIIMKN